MSSGTFDWYEDQRRRAQERERKLTTQAREMSSHELRAALEWEGAMSDHFAEIGQSNNCGEKATVIRMELARRGERW